MGVFKQSKNIYQFVSGVKKLNHSLDEIEQEKAKVYIQDLLQREGGLFTKIVQYMGTQNEDIEEMAFDRSKEVLSKSEVEEIVKVAYPDERIEICDEAYAASIGQVNRGQWNGKEVAVKIRYPGIKETLTDQLRILNILPKLDGVSPAKKWGFDYGIYQREFERLLREECDFTWEADKLKQWKTYLEPIEGIDVPEVYEALVREDIYLQEFIAGSDLLEIKALWRPQDKRQAAEKLIHGFFHLLFHHQTTQGDSNFGNYYFQNVEGKVQVTMIDLGQSVQFSDHFIETLFSGMHAYCRGQEFSTLGFFNGLGFDTEKLKAIGSCLPLLIEILFEPLLSNRPVNLANWNYKKDIDTLLGDNKWWFRSSGGVEFFLLMKAFMGLKNLCLKLNVNINWRQIFEEVAVGLEPVEIESVAGESIYKGNYQAKHLKIHIQENGRDKVKLQLPFMTLFTLDDFLSSEVQELIQNHHYDLDQVIKTALSDGGQAKELVNLKDKNKTYRILIE